MAKETTLNIEKIVAKELKCKLLNTIQNIKKINPDIISRYNLINCLK
ncbi:hypothetical protein MNB_ARC-1_962 [hydrothermal vent metagenome]|uniref:Uncharacterized protein n=1 Tax=hydrothermal vent metagenome TaxID=652676 RepID=A0A3B1E265_9ZZZZ